MAFPFDFYRTLRFATRLPLPVLAREEADPIVSADGFAPAFALSGAVVALIGGLVMALTLLVGSAPALAALLCVTAMVITTGGLHEDGLADCADGLGGGRTRARKLEIMRDPTIGTYGVLALVLSIGGRVAALASLALISPWAPLLALLGTQSLSRALSMMLASRLAHAREDGAAARLGRPSLAASALSLAIAIALMLAGLWPLLGGKAFTAGALVLLVTSLLAALVGRSAKTQIGGQSGDVLGANQQVCDLAGLITLSISIPMLI